MFTENNAHFFLGANTPKGFFSLYDNLNVPRSHDLLYIIKGGPGCGKSTFMKNMAGAAAGGVEYIHCSGDPDSLDAVVLKNHRLAYVDGTAPHVLEPVLPAVTEQYLNFGACYDMAAARELKSSIGRANLEYKELYKKAYHLISAAGEIHSALLSAAETPQFLEKAEKRARGVIRREVPHRSKGTGERCLRFLGGLTCKGEITLWETVTENYSKVFQLMDNFGLSHALLSPIAAAFEKAGCRIIVCPCHYDPQRIRHLLVPELSIAFVTSTTADPFPGKAYRRIRVDAMGDTSSPAMRRMRRELRQLTDAAADALRDAKAAHDALEELYHPCVNFAAVDAITAAHISALRE